MPYIVRICESSTPEGRDLIATAHETPEEAGRYAAEFPVAELMEDKPDGNSGASVTARLTFKFADGDEEPVGDAEAQLFACAYSDAAQQQRSPLNWFINSLPPEQRADLRERLDRLRRPD